MKIGQNYFPAEINVNTDENNQAALETGERKGSVHGQLNAVRLRAAVGAYASAAILEITCCPSGL